MTAQTAEPRAGTRRPEFHALRIASIVPLTSDAVAITFEVPAELADAYAFAAGQHLTLRSDLAGDGVRRSYSICSAEGGPLRIGVKRLPGGAFSEKALAALGVGDTVEVMTPMGRFGSALRAADHQRLGFVGAGSGITPVLSLVQTALESTDAEVSLVCANRTAGSVMFLDEIADLKDRFPTRLHLVHVLSREPQESELLSGRLDRERMQGVLRTLVDPQHDAWFLCGPFDLVTAAHEALVLEGVEAGAIHSELFHAESMTRPAAVEPTPGGTQVTARLDGRESAFTMDGPAVVLDALLTVRGDAPYACKGGVCGTCRARVLEGEVVMDSNWALEPEEIERGYVLTCQSHPTTETLRLDYDA
jgi:ring-1,2-phenylacetyl-CoA epoxidase subunit PaaE